MPSFNVFTSDGVSGSSDGVSGETVGCGVTVGASSDGVCVGTGVISPFSPESGSADAWESAWEIAPRIPLEENVAPLTASTPDRLCLASTSALIFFHALLKNSGVSVLVFVIFLIFPFFMVTFTVTGPSKPSACPS